MTIILRGAYTHRVFNEDPSTSAWATDCGMPVRFFDRLHNETDVEAERLVDCPGCIRARLDPPRSA